jgi:2'-5' RNA ligase
VRWSRPAQLHLTLRFLGECTRQQQANLTPRLAELAAGTSPLVLEAGALGAFPNWRQPSVIWLGITERHAKLSSLQQAVEEAVRAAGLPPEPKRFSPHVTLARGERTAGREPLQKLGDLVRGTAYDEGQVRPVDELRALALVRSHLAAHGSTYEIVAQWALAGPAADASL